MGVRVRQQGEKGEHAEQVTPCSENTDGQRWTLCYLSTPLLREAPTSRAAWRPGKSTAGRKGRSASSLHCSGKEDEYGRLKRRFRCTNNTRNRRQLFQTDATSVPVGAAGGREEVYGWCCADGAPAGRDWRCVCGGEGGPLGELLEPLFLSNKKTERAVTKSPLATLIAAGKS